MKTLALNRKASREYGVLDIFKAGIKLEGYEVKAIREGKADFEGSYVKILDGRPVVLGLNVGRYSKQGEIPGGTDPTRTRELLLKNFEIERLALKSSQKGFALVPLKFVDDHGIIKLEFALAKGKKAPARKEDLKIKQTERDLQREAKGMIRG